ncbi:LysR family transcriptional regulator [Agaribacter marinus]|uniref:LysR family transcriptional regulator n=1 Tax=Virgibacillus salarius TaxID=447199 RepID=A0A941DT92_9BACI|nr:LysR family transcriptional regulator [uncultured Virgibacillus sp.]MBR7794967.1 LysR family transcriptional regulator [Virgibacillus salarius]NAZ07687.1 LysR family transcriptional regulator [Agaribacter marinus]
MEIKHLQYFIEVTRAGSFTQAATTLYITQPAISRIIKSLEEELGVSLFIRSRKQLSLTEAGRVLYEHAQNFVEQYQAMMLDLDQVQQLKKGHMRIGLPSITNSFFFSQLIASFHEEYPEITFQLDEDGSKRIEEKVLHDKLDFGVVVLPTTHDEFYHYSFIKEGLKVVVPSGHPLAVKQQVRLLDLKHESFIMFNKDFSLRDSIVTACEDAGFEPYIISETSQLDFMEEMVASNVGITLLPESTSTELTNDVKAIAVENPTIVWDLALIWKRDRQLPQVMEEFIRFAKEKLLRNES